MRRGMQLGMSPVLSIHEAANPMRRRVQVVAVMIIRWVAVRSI